MVKLVLKGYTYSPLTLSVTNKAHNKLNAKVQQTLLFIYFYLLSLILRKECSQSLLLYDSHKILFTYDLFFLSAVTNIHKSSHENFSREATSLGKIPIDQEPALISKGQR